MERVLTDHSVPADAVFARVDSGKALETVRNEHELFVGTTVSTPDAPDRIERWEPAQHPRSTA